MYVSQIFGICLILVGKSLPSDRPTDLCLTNAKARPKGFRNKLKYIIFLIKTFAVRPPDRSASHKRRGPVEKSNEIDDNDDDDDDDDDYDDGDLLGIAINTIALGRNICTQNLIISICKCYSWEQIKINKNRDSHKIQLKWASVFVVSM